MDPTVATVVTASPTALLWTAAAVAFAHTLLSPDHTLPWVLMARAQNWPLRRTLALTALGSALHVGAAAAVAALAAGALDGARVGLQTSLLVSFGLVYGSWALWRGRRRRLAAGDAPPARRLAAGVLLLALALGPCEALVPLLMVPGGSLAARAAVGAVFAAVTIGTMLLVVTALALGSGRLRRAAEPWAHAAAGFGVAAAAGAAHLLGG